MTADIWTTCDGINHIQSLDEIAWRLVETQEKIATRKLVDSFEEHILLDSMIDSHRMPNNHLTLHELLSKPFKYPPLNFGSRFGYKTEPSLWYGSLQFDTALAEKAFYRFNFIRASDAKYGLIEQTLTGFSTTIVTEKGIKLTLSPFCNYRTTISSSDSYETSQQLGLLMRASHIQAFTYFSARDVNDGINIALFTPQAFFSHQPEPNSFQSWLCLANDEHIEFIKTNTLHPRRVSFSLHQFLINGTLPFPAS